MLIAASCQHQPLLWIFLLLILPPSPFLLYHLLLLCLLLLGVVGTFYSTLTNEYWRQSANISDLVSAVRYGTGSGRSENPSERISRRKPRPSYQIITINHRNKHHIRNK